MDGAPSLARHGIAGRFGAPVESGYRHWESIRLRPLGNAMAGASVVWWLAAPFLGQIASPPDLDRESLYLVSWALDVPVLVALLVLGRRLENRWGALTTTGITVISITSLVLLGPAIDADASVYLGATTFFGLLAPLAQLSFRTTIAVAIAVAGLGMFQAAFVEGSWTFDQSVLATGMLLAVLIIGPVMALASERARRAAYANEQIIERQQRQLADSRLLIRRYVPSAVAARIDVGDITVDQPQRRKVTIFFSDVVGFTALADRVDPEALAQIVNDYLGELSELIERHGGTLNEFAGDGVMAIFGAPDELNPADQVKAALAAAQELQRSLPTWSASWYQHGIIEDASARVGINTGTVSVGTFGSKVRATYTGIGLQTNIAARVQAQAEPGGILLSNTSWHLIKDSVHCEPRGAAMVKGVHFPIELYEPVER